MILNVGAFKVVGAAKIGFVSRIGVIVIHCF